jgi:hypothetical protein
MARSARTVLDADGKKGKARGGWHQRGPEKVQLRLQGSQTFEQYVTTKGWEQATLQRCPLCAPGTCHLQRLGTYMRKVPAVAYVARFYCPEQRTSFGLLPDFYASRMPGTLDAIEEAVAMAQEGTGIEPTAEQLRPADAPDAVSLSAAVGWVRRRVGYVRALFITVLGLLPDLLAGLDLTVRAWRERLGTSRVLVTLREICEPHLYALLRPLGLHPRARPVGVLAQRRPQSMGPDPPLGGR